VNFNYFLSLGESLVTRQMHQSGPPVQGTMPIVGTRNNDLALMEGHRSTNAGQRIVFKLFQQPFAPDFSLQYDLGRGSI
jgi:hypothetical protein